MKQAMNQHTRLDGSPIPFIDVAAQRRRLGNAIDDAVGVRLMELPLTPEAVFRALREKAGQPLETE